MTPLINQVCAISCGIFGGEIIVDLDYNEDSKCNADYNFVLSKSYKLIEIQGISEVGEISFEQLTKMYELGHRALRKKFLQFKIKHYLRKAIWGQTPDFPFDFPIQFT